MLKCLTIIFCIILSACATKPSTQVTALNIESLGNGIYVHHGVHQDIDDGYHGDICNVSFVIGSKGVAVIDTGGSLKVGSALHDAVKTVTKLPILYVINTHVHPDHIFGNAAFLADKPQFVGHYKLAETMQLRAESYAKLNARLLGEDATGTTLVKPTIAVKESIELDLGDRKLTLTAQPTAHTNTDLTVFDSKTQTLWTGDLLFVERTPVVEGDIKGWIPLIDKLKGLALKQVVPGHGAVPADWQAAFNNEQRYLSVLLSDIRANIKKGKTMESTMNTAAQSEKANWQLFDIANRRNINMIFPQLEWE